MSFYSIENFKTCTEAFQRYCESANLQVSQKELSVTLYAIVKEYADSKEFDAKKSIRDHNNHVLNILRETIDTQQQQQPRKQQHPPKQQQQPQSRNELFSNRPMPSAYLMTPESSSSLSGNRKAEVDSVYERMLAERDMSSSANHQLPPPPLIASSFEQNTNSTSVDDLVSGSGGENSSYMSITADIRDAVPRMSPSEFAMQLQENFSTTPEASSSEFDKFRTGVPFAMPPSDAPPMIELDDYYSKSLQGRVNPDYRSVETLKNYVSINGADRDWVAYKFRYSYLADIGTRLRNVREIRPTCVVLPMEIHEKKTLTMIPKANFQHDYGLMYPYLLLNVEECNGTYTGATNSAVRQCTSKFVFDSSYRSPNGRGFMLMRPMQDERKLFRPAPLASLSSLRVSVRKPNGTLYNNSIDDFEVVKVEHEVFNNMYLKIVLDKYFDRNEFYIGDTIQMRNVRFSKNNPPPRRRRASSSSACSSSSTSSSSDDCETAAEGRRNDDAGLIRLAEFLNRPEGHEIVEIGQANAQGFHNNFYILAPGTLDQLRGHVDLDCGAIGALKRFWEECESDKHDDGCSEDDKDECHLECSEESDVSRKNKKHRRRRMGHVINATLQNVISFTVNTFEGDVSCLNVSIVGGGG